jgi:protein-tyrosine-phosphatase/predicted ATP-grasp superfamily ATP-dependent carboligase
LGTRLKRTAEISVLKVLVLDAGSRAAIESVQSMARRRVQVDAAAEGDSIAFSSKRILHRLRQPRSGQTDLFLEWLTQLDHQTNYSLIIPSTEGSLRHFLSLAESNPLRQKAVLASNASLQTALDKSLTLKMASKLGIPIPKTTFINQGEAAPVCETYPAVLKPVSSLVPGTGGLELAQSRIVRNNFERQDVLRQMLPKSAVLQQELVSGHGVGVEMLYREGKPVWHFCHERLHEGSGLPGLGSGSSYRKSILPDRELMLHTVALLDALQWHGVAMVEYKVAADGRFWLMEINPRLWGSLALAIDAGVDFPYGLLCIATGREVPPQPTYKIGYRTRLLLQDLDWLKNRLLYRPDKYIGVEILKLLRPIAGRESWDHFDWSDLAVTAADFRSFGAKKLQSLKRKLAISQQERDARELHANNLQRLLASREKPRKILFLCHGNICRSPVAESLIRLRYPAFDVQSAGFHPAAGRSSPPHIQKLAREFSIDLSNHFSRCVTADMACDADTIFLHDMRNYDHFCGSFPQDKNKILFLGLFCHPPLLEIKDPYDLNDEETSQVLRQIYTAVCSIGRMLLDSAYRPT